MKIFKKLLSSFMAAVMIVSTACVGTITASAGRYPSEYTLKGEVDGSYYIITLGGIGYDEGSEERVAFNNSAINYTDIQFAAKDGVYTISYTYLTTRMAHDDDFEKAYFAKYNANGKPGNREELTDVSFTVKGEDVDLSNPQKKVNYTFKISKSGGGADFIAAISNCAEATVRRGTVVREERLLYRDGPGECVVKTDFEKVAASDKPTSTPVVEETKKTTDISTLTISKPSNKTYTGKNRKASVTVKNGSTTLKNGTDYTLTYKNCKNIGTASVTITGKGDYSGSKTLTYKIVPKKTTLKVSKKSDTKAKFSWAKVKGAEKYQIYYSTNGGKSYKKLATVSGSKTSYTSSKLDFDKYNYKFKIRSYKTVDGKKYYSSYSKVVTVK